MEIINILNQQIDTLLEKNKNLQSEIVSLRLILETLKNDNEKLNINNKEMVDKIDYVLALVKEEESE